MKNICLNFILLLGQAGPWRIKNVPRGNSCVIEIHVYLLSLSLSLPLWCLHTYTCDKKWPLDEKQVDRNSDEISDLFTNRFPEFRFSVLLIFDGKLVSSDSGFESLHGDDEVGLSLYFCRKRHLTPTKCREKGANNKSRSPSSRFPYNGHSLLIW